MTLPESEMILTKPHGVGVTTRCCDSMGALNEEKMVLVNSGLMKLILQILLTINFDAQFCSKCQFSYLYHNRSCHSVEVSCDLTRE